MMAAADKQLADKAFADPHPEKVSEDGRASSPKASDAPSKSKKDERPPPPPSPYDITLSLRTSDAGLDAARKAAHHLPSHHVPTLVASAAQTSGTLLKAAHKATGLQLPNSHPQEPESAPKKLLLKGKQKLLAARQKKSVNDSLMPLLTFENPWKSFRGPSAGDAIKGGLKWGLPEDYVHGEGKGGYKGRGKRGKGGSVVRDEALEKVEVKKPDWGRGGRSLEDTDGEEWMCAVGEERVRAVRVTWLGHASTLVQFPSLVREVLEDVRRGKEEAEATTEKHNDDDESHPKGAPPSSEADSSSPDPSNANANATATAPISHRSFNVLFDPIFSQRCSPSQSAGPFRFTPAPCTAQDLPPIDAIFISHNHYDHLDQLSLKSLRKLASEAKDGSRLHVFVPLGNKAWFVAEGFGKEDVTELDWWDEASIVPRESDERGKRAISRGKMRIISTPAQHGSGRGAGDKNTALWSSWFLEFTPPAKGDEEPTPFRVFFAGDTGLRFHNESRKPRTKYPVCPAFKEISLRFSAPDVLLLPISVGSSLSYLRQWDPFPRRFSPFPRVESPLTSAIHADGLDAVHMLKIMGGTKDAEELEGPRVEEEGYGTERGGEEKRRIRRPKKMTAVAVHFGTFVRNDEQTRGDVFALRRACADHGVRFVRAEEGRIESPKAGLGEGGEKKGDEDEDEDPELSFVVAHQGETIWLPLP